jgi:GNAT superfamily N-acetyltransferase
MLIREVISSDLDGLLELYLYLHEEKKLRESDELKSLWNNIISDGNYHILIGEIDGKIISSVTLVVIKNLTRNMRPYALIENVVTHADFRKKGYATELINKACEIAAGSGCYKVMLLTGSKKESTLKFYRECGFNSDDKTAFIKWL